MIGTISTSLKTKGVMEMYIRQSIKTFLVFLTLIVIWTNGHAQPNIPKSEIPADIPKSVRGQIEALYSSNGRVRAVAAHKLGQIGAKADPAIPFLIGLLDDEDMMIQIFFYLGRNFPVDLVGRR